VLPLPVEVLPCRPKFYGLWTQDRLNQAFSAVEKGTGVRRAVEMFGVPHFTLHDHVSGKGKQFA
jgi:hypothetical protein